MGSCTLSSTLFIKRVPTLVAQHFEVCTKQSHIGWQTGWVLDLLQPSIILHWAESKIPVNQPTVLQKFLEFDDEFLHGSLTFQGDGSIHQNARKIIDMSVRKTCFECALDFVLHQGGGLSSGEGCFLWFIFNWGSTISALVYSLFFYITIHNSQEGRGRNCFGRRHTRMRDKLGRRRFLLR